MRHLFFLIAILSTPAWGGLKKNCAALLVELDVRLRQAALEASKDASFQFLKTGTFIIDVGGAAPAASDLDVQAWGIRLDEAAQRILGQLPQSVRADALGMYFQGENVRFGQVPDGGVALSRAGVTRIADGELGSHAEVYLHPDLASTEVFRRLILLHEVLRVSLKRDFAILNPHRAEEMLLGSHARAELFLEMASAAMLEKIYRLPPAEVANADARRFPRGVTGQVVWQDYIVRTRSRVELSIQAANRDGRSDDLNRFLDWLHEVSARQAQATTPSL